MGGAMKAERPSRTVLALGIGAFLYAITLQWWLFPSKVASVWDVPMFLFVSAVVLRLIEAFDEWKERRT